MSNRWSWPIVSPKLRRERVASSSCSRRGDMLVDAPTLPATPCLLLEFRPRADRARERAAI
eukprot:scaffold38702_cov30-Tisochrysis_lutea.AAC.3